MPEYCGVISQNPITHGSFKRMAVEAKKFDYSVLDQAVASAEAIPVDSIIENVNQAQAVEIIDDVGPDDVVIDIRKSEMAKAHPLSMEGVLTIPFHELNRAFKNWMLPSATCCIVRKGDESIACPVFTRCGLSKCEGLSP